MAFTSQQPILIFCFFLFHYLFSSICGHNFDRIRARKSSIPSRICLVKEGDVSQNKIFIGEIVQRQ